jgi:methylenetetrahydrofolate dehydrogenase (NADP+) / methenyltetrahydrofolate cyclohydrolase
MKIIDGKKIAKQLRENIKEEVYSFIKKTGITPSLGVVLASDNPASKIYIKKKQQACSEVGIKSSLFHLDLTSTTNSWKKLCEQIEELNNTPNLHGYLVQLPLHDSLKKHTLELFDKIAPEKDVDVFNPKNVGLLVQNRPNFLPCTPRGIQLLLKHSNIKICGKHVVIINRSEIVGKPLSSMLIQDSEYANATVTVCHDHTPPEALKKMTLQADIIIVAVGIPGFITKEMVKKGVVIIDVGITRVGKNLLGDVNFEEVAPLTSQITPVPGGVGPMTVTTLLQNTLTAAQLYAKKIHAY